MKKIFIKFSVLVTVFLIGNIVFGQNDEVIWNTLTKKDYTINYPSNWQLKGSIGVYNEFVILSPITSRNDRVRENVNLVIQPTYSSLKEHFSEMVYDLKRAYPNIRVQVSEKVGNYYKGIFEVHQNNLNFRVEQRLWVRDNKAYILTFTCEKEQYWNYSKIG